MLDMFERWQSQQAFPEWDCLGHIHDHPEPTDPDDVMARPVAVRRGLAMRKTLLHLLGPWGRKHGFSSVHPDELIVGTMPPYSVGQGKEVMGYMTEDEEFASEVGFLNGWSNFGHIVPNHEKVVQHGLRALIDQCNEHTKATQDDGKAAFYQSVVHALEGVILYARGYAGLAREQADAHAALLRDNPRHPTRELFEERIAGMKAVADRLERIPAGPCESFTDAVQCVYLMNCALHWTGELTSLGRLDQVLFPYYRRDSLPREAAQEVIDCLWVKLDERVMLDRRHFVDRFSSADGALLGAGGASNFDQGALANQWMQQLTIGGVKATNDRKQEDASNDITRMCLEAARKFPFNCPTLDLRVHKDTPGDLLELAAEALLSGGAHPILMNDDKLIPALHRKSGGKVDLASARNYACDGCYETLFPGETEFSFIYIPAVDVLEKALNSGAGFAFSGGTYLRGAKGSYRTPSADRVRDFAHFYQIMEKHIWLNVNRQLAGLLRAYGCKGGVCPTPILSAMIDGCIETGRDLYAGGARYHMFAPLMTGISTVADSLHVIDRLVFHEKRFSLEELVACLRSDWGLRTDVIGMELPAERAAAIREECLGQPRFGTGNRQVDAYAWRLINSFVDAVERARNHPYHQDAFRRLSEGYDEPGRPFEVLLTPGVGTFEQYLFGGSFAGATPDGRRALDSLATDLSAAPLPRDREPILRDDTDPEGPLYARQHPLLDSLSSWNDPAVDRLSDGAPSDFNIREDFPRDRLVKVLKAFAAGKGSNVMTVTVANPETLRDAEQSPDRYNLVRVRMGGWTEFFSVLFDDHRAHHRRRPVYTP
jgi:pyruvate-formate lyase